MYSQRIEHTSHINRLRLAGYLLIALGVGLLLGGLSAQFSTLAVLGVGIAGVAIVFTLQRPEIGLLVILVATSTVIAENDMPRAFLGFGKLYVTDVILLALLGLALVRQALSARPTATGTPLDLPLILFFGIAILATFLAVGRGSITYIVALTKLRLLTYYLTFFVVTKSVLRDRQIKFLLGGMFFLAALVALAMIAQFTMGASLSFLPGRVEALQTEGTTYPGITRILPPGQSLVLVGFIAITFILFLGKSTPGTSIRLALWVLLGAAVVLTFNRSFWVAVLIAFILGAYLIRGQDKRKIFGWGLGLSLVVAISLIAIFYDPESRAAGLASATLHRLGTVFTTETFGDPLQSSLRWRDFEYKYAIPQFLAHPIIGIGHGAQYRPWIYNVDRINFDGRPYIHNGHLWILMKTGLLGYLPFLWLSIVFLGRGFRYWRRIPDPTLQATVLSFTLTYLGLLFIGIVAPVFMDWFWMPVIGLMMGINEVIIRNQVLHASHQGGLRLGS